MGIEIVKTICEKAGYNKYIISGSDHLIGYELLRKDKVSGMHRGDGNSQ